MLVYACTHIPCATASQGSSSSAPALYHLMLSHASMQPRIAKLAISSSLSVPARMEYILRFFTPPRSSTLNRWGLQPWAQEETTQLLIEVFVNRRFPDFRSLGRSREEVERRLQDICEFTLNHIRENDPGFDPIDKFYESQAPKSSPQQETSAVAATRCNKEETTALFKIVQEKGPYTTCERSRSHYYEVMGMLFLEQAPNRSLEEGIEKAVRNFYAARCPKAGNCDYHNTNTCDTGH
jgi:hypothetical protein